MWCVARGTIRFAFFNHNKLNGFACYQFRFFHLAATNWNSGTFSIIIIQIKSFFTFKIPKSLDRCFNYPKRAFNNGQCRRRDGCWWLFGYCWLFDRIAFWMKSHLMWARRQNYPNDNLKLAYSNTLQKIYFQQSHKGKNVCFCCHWAASENMQSKMAANMRFRGL